MTIWFDMDGTIADLYGVAGWLESLRARDVRPYTEAKGIGNLALIARLLNKVQVNGHEIGIISWTAKNAPAEYNARIYAAKVGWLGKHFPSVNWDTILVKPYGTDKKVATGGGILFDDEKPNRDAWGAGAYEPRDIVKILKKVAEKG